MSNSSDFDEQVIEHPITSELDLHTFKPNEIGELIPEYFYQCRERDIFEVRIVHGKGTGALRRGVIALLEKSPDVISFRSGDETEGSWGATIVKLKPLS